jgi:Ankyrin repeats (3 copies)
MGSVTDELFELILDPVIDEQLKKKNLDKIGFLLTNSTKAKELGIKSVVIDFNTTKFVMLNKYSATECKLNVLSVAIIMGKIDVVKLLIQSGMNPNKPDTWHTPLSCAASQKNVELVNYLIQVGALINNFDVKFISYNPLIAACAGGSYEVMKILLLHNAKMDYISDNNKRAIDFIPTKGHEKEINLLKAAESFQKAIVELGKNPFAAKKALYSALELDADFVLSYMVKIAHTANLRGQGLPHNEAFYHPHLLRLFVKNTKADIKTLEGFIEDNFSKERVKELLDELNAYELNSEHFDESELLFKTPEEKEKTLKWLEKGTEFEQAKAKMKKPESALADKLAVANSPVFSANTSASEDKQLKEPVPEKMENNSLN